MECGGFWKQMTPETIYDKWEGLSQWWIWVKTFPEKEKLM